MNLSSMLFRISVEGEGIHGGPKGMPGFGGQIQTRAIFGQVPEGEIVFQYRDTTIILSGDSADSDGDRVTLRIPTYTLINPWKPLSALPLLSPRVAPAVFGLGLLEALSESEILAFSDPDDRDGDGISGRPNYVYDVEYGQKKLGRFGWKANTPTLKQQNAAAFNQDMGITNPLFKNENCDEDRIECKSEKTDIDSATLEDVFVYIRTLAVPGRRDWNKANIQKGEKLFQTAKCADCHLPTLHTQKIAGSTNLSNQTIHPYTDLLLHDMGSGLDDNRPDFSATGSEWRTAPLWGIGLTKVVNGHNFFLHDGRARNILEAILWHQGEADFSRETVIEMSKKDREALLAFIESL